MRQQHSELATAHVVRAIEDNLAEFLLALGRAAGAEERNDPAIHWTIGGSPIDYHNCVVRANLTPATVDPAIQASIAAFRAHHVPGTWHVGPSMHLLDLGERLVAHGFVYAGSEQGMAVELEGLTQTPMPVAGLRVTRVVDASSLVVWTETLAQGFGEGPREAEWVGAMVARIGLGDDVPWRHYLGYTHDIPVATASMFLADGVAGIYFVFTTPAARRQGIGTAITYAALQDARRLGCRLAVLSASEMGYPVYQRLGFRKYCTIEIYEWRP